MLRTVEILDTTLRDGEQTDGVSFTSFEKKQIARMLLEKLGVDRIEIASARVSPGELESAREIFQWAKTKDFTDRIEILGFVDHRGSIDWIEEAGGRVINLLTKGSRKHCELQLGKTLEGHLADIEKTIRYANDKYFIVNVYLEDWSNGFQQSPDYVISMLSELRQLPITRILLPDTLGILKPEEVTIGIRQALDAFPDLRIDFHGHNDYDLATANCLAAAQAGARGIHVSVNGLGERAGNSPLESVVTALHDKLDFKTNVVESAIMDVARMVETFSGKRIGSNRAIVGQDVYTQTAGIHADGDRKNNLYVNPILPERFGRERVYALGKLAGKASIANNLSRLGLDLSPEREKALLDRVKQLGEQKKTVTADDIPFLLEDIFGQGAGGMNIRILNYVITTRSGGRPVAEIEVAFFDKVFKESGEGDGGYDAFMNALRKVGDSMGMKFPLLFDYEVRIPPGGKTDALVETVVIWEATNVERKIRTVGVDPDQVVAAIKATEKMLNRYIPDEETFHSLITAPHK